jgi:hypothetical protein
MICWAEGDELVGGEQCALHESAFEAALPTDEALLHSGVRLARDANNRYDQELPHTSNETKMSDRASYNGFSHAVKARHKNRSRFAASPS